MSTYFVKIFLMFWGYDLGCV